MASTRTTSTSVAVARRGIYGLDLEEAIYEYARETATGMSLDASNSRSFYILFNEDHLCLPLIPFDSGR